MSTKASNTFDHTLREIRYRIKDGALTFHYELDNPHRVVEHATRELMKQIEEATGLQAFLGSF